MTQKSYPIRRDGRFVVKLYNNFHNTQITLHVRNDGRLSIGQCRRIRRTLCGMNDCFCSGGALGIRGPQEWHVAASHDSAYRAEIGMSYARVERSTSDR